MGTKTIRVREEVYERLQARKRPGESFSDLLDRLTDRDAAFELAFGVVHSNGRELGELAETLSWVEFLKSSVDDAVEGARVHAELQDAGTRLPIADAIIAGAVRNRGRGATSSPPTAISRRSMDSPSTAIAPDTLLAEAHPIGGPSDPGPDLTCETGQPTHAVRSMARPVRRKRDDRRWRSTADAPNPVSIPDEERTDRRTQTGNLAAAGTV